MLHILRRIVNLFNKSSSQVKDICLILALTTTALLVNPLTKFFLNGKGFWGRGYIFQFPIIIIMVALFWALFVFLIDGMRRFSLFTRIINQLEKSNQLNKKDQIQENRLLYLDILKILASFAVVVIHTSAVINQIPYSANSSWWVANVLNSISRWSVPVFFMVSGASLLGYRKKYSTIDFFKKRLVKVVIPFIVWTFIYAIWQYKTHQFGQLSFLDFINFFTHEPVTYHMWFFYTIIGLYLIVPILSLITCHGSKKLVYFLIILCIMVNQVFPLIEHFTHLHIGFPIPITGAYLDYFLLGWILKDISGKKQNFIILYIAGLFSMLFTILSCVPELSQAFLDFDFTGYETLTTLITSIAVFVFVRNQIWEVIIRSKGLKNIIHNLSDASFGIYIVHVMVKYFFLNNYNVQENSLQYQIFGPMIIFLLSYLVVTILRKFPVFKQILP